MTNFYIFFFLYSRDCTQWQADLFSILNVVAVAVAAWRICQVHRKNANREGSEKNNVQLDNIPRIQTKGLLNAKWIMLLCWLLFVLFCSIPWN